jgi:dTDP-glucose 4,6-dehydratase
LMITNAMEGQSIPVYGKGLNRREWIYVDDHSRGVWNAVTQGRDGEIYNIGSGAEISNIDLVRRTLRAMGQPDSLIRFVEDRPAHDLRYAMDCTKIEREWGWRAETDLDSGLARTIDWYRTHMDWVREVKDSSYRSYYERQYADRERTLVEE